MSERYLTPTLKVNSRGGTETAIRGYTEIDQEIVPTRIHTVQAVETGLGTSEDHGKETW